MTGLLDRHAPQKRRRQLSSYGESDTASSQVAGPSQPAIGGGSKEQAITILGSPELGPLDQMEPMGVARIESKEVDPVPSTL